MALERLEFERSEGKRFINFFRVALVVVCFVS